MLEYTGIKCPVCEIPFKDDDDVVVCPSCGAPYHRSCYREVGSCVFEEELHRTGKAWAAPEPPQPPDLNKEIKDKECPVCGTLNAHSALFCNRCGASLDGQPDQHYENRNTYTAPPPPSASAKRPSPFTPTLPFAFDPMGGVSPTEQLDDQVSFGDASKLVKQNTTYYMPTFRYMKTTGKNKFNFCAFLCSGPWMLYRKQYKYGSIITAIQFILYLSYTFLTLFVSEPRLLALMEQVGMDSSESLSLSSPEMQEMTELLMQDLSTYFLIALPLICLLSILVIMIVMGVRGNKIYMRHCIRTIQKIKSENTNDDVNIAIETRGGVNMGITICLFVCCIIISNIALFV